MEKKHSKEEIKGLINQAHKSITRKKGKDYSPTVHEIQKWIDNHLSTEPNKKDKIKGGMSDNKSLSDIATKHGSILKDLKNQLNKGIKVEMEHTKDESTAKEIAMDHLWEDPNYYTKLSKIEPKESTGADSSGSFSSSFNSTPIKKKINKIHNMEPQMDIDEVTTSGSSGQYDAPFGSGGKNPLKIGGEESIKQSRAVKDKNFPKWGGPDGVFIKVKEKCKKFPYCNQGDINAIEMLEMDELTESVKNVSKITGIPFSDLEKTVINEINKIFIK